MVYTVFLTDPKSFSHLFRFYKNIPNIATW